MASGRFALVSGQPDQGGICATGTLSCCQIIDLAPDLNPMKVEDFSNSNPTLISQTGFALIRVQGSTKDVV